MKRALPFVLIAVGIVVIGVLIRVLTAEPPLAPSGEAVVMPLAEVHLEVPEVRLVGMAHYPVVIRQVVPGNIFKKEQTWFLFPLFKAGDTSDRAVRVLVRTTRKPDRYVSYEHMKLEGRVRRPTPDIVPFNTEIALGKRSDYFFTDEMVVLEPWWVESEGEVWRHGDAE